MDNLFLNSALSRETVPDVCLVVVSIFKLVFSTLGKSFCQEQVYGDDLFSKQQHLFCLERKTSVAEGLSVCVCV